jgi:hypothetical protein
MHRAALFVLWIAGCAADEPVTIDAPPPGPISFTIGASWCESPYQGPPAHEPTIVIDSVARTRLEIEYESYDAAIADSHLVELRYGDTVVRAETYPLAGGCLRDDRPSTHYQKGVCAYKSGDLRYATGHTSNAGGVMCIEDGFSQDQCSQFCPEPYNGMRCGSRIVLTDPPASHLACVPIGPKHAGEACTMIAAPDGAYDDCGAELMCLDGVCRSWMRISPYVDVEGCSFVTGYAPEVRLCRDPT